MAHLFEYKNEKTQQQPTQQQQSTFVWTTKICWKFSKLKNANTKQRNENQNKKRRRRGKHKEKWAQKGPFLYVGAHICDVKPIFTDK